MIWYCIIGCAVETELGVPGAEIFISDQNIEGILQISSHQGSTNKEAVCTTIYAIDGMQEDCDECSWEAMLSFSLLSEACIFSDIEALRFQVRDNDWMVLEQSGWEQWGEAEEVDSGVWYLTPSYALLP